MKLVDVLREECIVAGARLDDKGEALREIVQTAKKSPILKDVGAEEMLAGLEERESLGSTGFGKGIAIPHCRLESVTDFVVGIITVPDGVNFEALDGEKVNLIIFIIAPQAEPDKHIKLLSAISQTLLIPGAVEEIVSEGTCEAVRESFLRYTRADIDATKQTTKSLFSVFVQEEKVFQDILEKLAGLETASVVVLNTESTAAYLSRIPLFADFWRDKPSKFSRLILAIMEKGLTNETIRRIESITGDLNKCVGVTVTVQEVTYAAGSL